MSFIDFKDPMKRDDIVAEYLATVKRIQQRNLNEKAQDLARQDDLWNVFKPVAESTGKSTEAITRELAPMREEMKNLNERLEAAAEAAAATPEPQAKQKRGKRKLDVGSGDLDMVDQYITIYDETKLDRYFSIQRTGVNRYMMGDKNVLVDTNSNIFIGGVKYERTPGLWALIMMKTPHPNSTIKD